MQRSDFNIHQYRDFGGLLGDTFAFIRQEINFLIKVLLIYAGPFILVSAIAGAWFQSGFFSLMGMMMRNNPMDILTEFGLKFAVYMGATLVSNTVLISVIYSYMGLYAERGRDGFTQEDVWYLVGKKFFSVLLSLLVVGFIIFVGAIFCIIPGIFFAVSFCLVFAVINFENLPLGGAMSRSMELLREDWWFALGIGIVIYLIVLIASYLFALPSAFFSMFISFSTLKGDSSETIKIIYMVIFAAGTFCASFLASITHITFSLFYYSLIEKKESPGLLKRIEKINKDSNPEDKYPDTY